MAKSAKHMEAADVDTFRARAREQYVEKRAEGRLVVAQRTCVTQDTQAGMLVRVSHIRVGRRATYACVGVVQCALDEP
jgi:hypothetical protein